MEISQSGSDGLTLGHIDPIGSLVGTIHHIRAAAFGEDGGTVEALREVMKRQLSNLVTMKHPYSERVRKVITRHGCSPSKSFRAKERMNIIDRLFKVNKGLFRLEYEIEKKVAEKKDEEKKLIPFEHAEEPKNPETIEHPIAA